MGSALAPEWCDRYVSLGIELGIPALLTGTLGAYGPNNHLAGDGIRRVCARSGWALESACVRSPVRG